MRMNSLVTGISETIFPSNIYCMVCGSLIDGSRPYSLCDECARKIHWIGSSNIENGFNSKGRTCQKCGKALQDEYRGNICYDCMNTEHYFERGFSCLTYGFYEREMMMDIKYNNKGYMASKLGDVLFDRMSAMIYEAAESGLILFDCVIPVPVSEKRLYNRGYNQSELMTRQMLRRWKEAERENPAVFSPVMENRVLIRARETVMLRSLNPEERRMALKGAFVVKKGTEDRVANKSVLLVDDIYTTGATADACSKALLEAGADSVYLLTLASGGNRRSNELEKKRD